MKTSNSIFSVFAFFGLLLLTFVSCEKNITVDLPDPESKIVVDGYIEKGLPPYVLLSRSSGYFDPVSPGSINNLPVSDAVVLIYDGADTVQLVEIDTSFNGLTIRGFYAALDPVSNLPTMTGLEGREYHLHITTTDGDVITSFAKLHTSIPLDSTWFKIQDGKDSLGFVWARLSDPDTTGNCYRWFAKRITKDEGFIAPSGSPFDDRFINGQSFDFAYNRGEIQNSTSEDDDNEEDGFFKVGDTIIVKFTTVDRATYEFWRDAENQAGNNGSPFAVPSNIKSNITGGLGLFATYSAFIDTVYTQ